MIELAKEHIVDYYQSEDKPVVIEGKVLSQEDLVVVLAVGETSRQKNFSLYGYDKNTNPLLSKKDGLHALNGIAKYGSTIYALGEIFSRDDIKLTSITKTLGIQSSCFVNFQLYGNCGLVEEVFVSDCAHNGKCYDEDVIPLLKENLKTYKSGPEMIVLHIGGGSHGPMYQNRFPPEFQKFQPQCTDADVMNKCTKEEIYNAFDNTILYVDYVVSNIIDTLDDSKVPYILIYLSDHGESLLEGDRIFHGMPPGIDLPDEQAHIPLLVKSSIDITIKKQEEYKQQDIYDTILDLFSIQIDLLRKDKVFITRDK
jgi:lipid A ethanolaminephosphotransferase